MSEAPLGGERGEEAARARKTSKRGGVGGEEARDAQPELGGQPRRRRRHFTLIFLYPTIGRGDFASGASRWSK